MNRESTHIHFKITVFRWAKRRSTRCGSNFGLHASVRRNVPGGGRVFFRPCSSAQGMLVGDEQEQNRKEQRPDPGSQKGHFLGALGFPPG